MEEQAPLAVVLLIVPSGIETTWDQLLFKVPLSF